MSNELEEAMAPRYMIGNWPHVLNMANSIIGVSVLALPFCFKQCGILLGFLLLMGSAWLTRLTCHLLMKSAFATKKRSYEYLAFHIFGRAGKLLVELSIIGLLIGTCIAFYIIIGDLGPAVVSKVTGLENTPQLRSALLILLTGFIVVPLAMLHSLDSLSNFSAISLTFYCVFVVEVIIAAFPNLWSGIWVSKVVFWNTDGVFKCLPIFALCFACQTQLFLMSDALPEPSLNRINRIVHSAVLMCSVIYVSVGCFGYIAFCDDYISGDILMNFSPTFFSEAIKLGFVTSTLISFPLVIFPCRASLYTLLFVRKGLHDNFGGAVYIPPSYFKGITISIIGVTLTIGILVPNIEFMLAITGATMGSLICYILPAVLFITAISVDHGGNTRSFAQLVLLIGVTILLASSYVTLTSDEKVVKHESVVKLGQPIEHNEDNLAIHNDEDLKKKLDEMKEQLEPDDAKPGGKIDPDFVGLIHKDVKDVKDAVTAAAAAVVPPVKQEVIESITVSKDVDKNKQVIDIVDKNKQVVDDIVDKNKEVKEVEVADKKSPDTEEEADKRKEPPNPHAPFDEVVVQANIDDLKKGNVDDDQAEAAVGNQTHEENAVNDKNPIKRSIDSEPKMAAEKQPNDEKVIQVTDVQQQGLYGKPALVDVLQPKLESQSAPGDGKETVKKAVDADVSHEKPQLAKSDEDAKLVVEPVAEKAVKAGGTRSAEAHNESLERNLELGKERNERRPVEVQHVLEKKTRKAEVPDEQKALLKTIHALNVSVKAVDNKVPVDRNAADDQHEAKIIIAELKKQQEEQRELLNEQRKIIDEMKRHQIEVHKERESQGLKAPEKVVGENVADKAKPELVHESREKRELPAGSLEKEERTGKVVANVSSKEELGKAEKVVVTDSPKAVKQNNVNPYMDDSHPKLDENINVVKKNVVEMERPANANFNGQDSNDHAKENGKTGDENKIAVEMERHPDVKGHPDIKGHPDVKGHLDVKGHPDVKGHLDIKGHPDVKGHPDNEMHPHVEKDPAIKRLPDVKGHPDIKEHPDVKGHPDIKEHPAVEGHPDVKGHSDVKGHPDIRGHPDIKGHPDVKHSPITIVDSGQQNEKIAKRDNVRDHVDEIVLKEEEKLNFVANEKLKSSQHRNISENNIPEFVSKKS